MQKHDFTKGLHVVVFAQFVLKAALWPWTIYHNVLALLYIFYFNLLYFWAMK